MKRFLLSVVLATTLALTSCQFDDSDIWNKFGEMEESIRDHEQRISALEELCKQMNTNISSLQAIVAALQNNDYVTAVVPVIKDGVTIGYTITFSKSQPITIYHGQDGKDGADGQDGKDGYTPQIGVMKDTDGIYYWTLDGEWLLDANGNKIKAVGTDGANGTDGKDGQDGTNGSDGKDGQDGTNGTDGKDGKDGVTPQLKIENDYWYVSYDNGATWVQLGKATGEDGEDGKNGDSGVIINVEESETEVVFTLADGSTITLPKGKKEEVVSENNKIYYTTSDNTKLFPKTDASLYGAILISNTYKDGQGVLTFDDAITSIGKSAFSGCTSLTSVTIPDSVTSIGNSAFYGCSSLTSVTISDSVTSIGGAAFYECSSLTSVTIPDSVTSIGSSVFSGCSGLTSVTIGNSVTSIGGAAFYECSSLTSVTIPDSVTSIGYDAFDGCTSLTDTYVNIKDLAAYTTNTPMYNIGGNKHLLVNGTEITELVIPDSVTAIGYWAFSGCTSLTSVTIPNSVTSIGSYAFAFCTLLTSVYCKPTTPPTASADSWGDWDAFYGNASGRKIYVPRNSVDAYNSAQYWSDYASDIEGYDF